jgi:translation initiation factor IF-1
MAGRSAFKVEGIVTEALPNGTFRVELPNGHRVLAFLAGKAKRTLAPPSPGERVTLQMSPYDLSQGRIVVE